MLISAPYSLWLLDTQDLHDIKHRHFSGRTKNLVSVARLRYQTATTLYDVHHRLSRFMSGSGGMSRNWTPRESGESDRLADWPGSALHKPLQLATPFSSQRNRQSITFRSIQHINRGNKKMTEAERLKCNAIDINGLNLCDRNRIEEVGFNAWLDEVSTQKTAAHVARQHRHRKKCAVCDAVFLATRADAEYCGHKCQLRGNRRGLAFRSLTENINENPALQAVDA
jgi:hypothetical protein